MNQDVKAFLAALTLAGVVGGFAGLPEWIIYLQSPSSEHSSARGQNERNGTGEKQAEAVNGILTLNSERDSQVVEQDSANRGQFDLPAWIQAGSAVMTLFATFAIVFLGREQLKVSRLQGNIMRRQTAISRRQVGISERQLVSQGPFLGYDLYNLMIKTDSSDSAKIREYRIHLTWRNFGKDFATDVTYWIGYSFESKIVDDAIWRQVVRKRFSDTIFKASGLDGEVVVAPGGTVETDQIIVSPERLRQLFRKEVRLMIWCVVGYGSRLQPRDWFAEIAAYLEFVLERDPDTYHPDPNDINNRPFRVAVVGYRYREDQDQRHKH